MIDVTVQVERFIGFLISKLSDTWIFAYTMELNGINIEFADRIAFNKTIKKFKAMSIEHKADYAEWIVMLTDKRIVDFFNEWIAKGRIDFSLLKDEKLESLFDEVFVEWFENDKE